MNSPTLALYPFRFLVATVLLALLSAGCKRVTPPEETPPPAPVKWMEARQFFVEEWTELLGTTQPLPERAARITAAIEGRVLSVLQGAGGKVVEGQHVDKGDVIVQLDASIARANRNKAAAAFEEAEQQVQQAAYAVELAQVELQSREDLSRKSAPGGPPLVSPIELKKAQIAWEEARSKQKGAKFHQAAVDKEARALDEQLKLFTLTAPISGRLGRIQVVPGQTLAPGAVVAEIADIETDIDVLCFVPPSVANRLKKGQAARVGALEEQALNTAPKTEGKSKRPSETEGRVEFIADQAEMDTGNFAVKVRFPNSALGLRGNVTLRIRVLTQPGRAALTLPESALFEDQDPPAVLVVENYKKDIKHEEGKEDKEVETGTARKLRVKLGIRDRVLHLVEILSLDDPEKKWQGTLETAKFVVERGQGLRNGDAIRLEQEDEEEAPPPPDKKD